MKMTEGIFPVRGQVEWTQTESDNVVIFVNKELGRFEAKIANFLGAPTIVSRPLDEMNSRLWTLMDGSRTLDQIVVEMDIIFAERIAPVAERVSRSIAKFVEMGLVVIQRKDNDIDS